MKLKMKTAGTIGITMAAFIILLFLFIRPVILNDAKLLDEESLNIDKERASTYMDEQGAALQRLNRDWSVWDDTYEFVQNRNEDYIESNMMLDTFQNNIINFMIFSDNSGNTVYSEGYDLRTSTPLTIESDFPSTTKLTEATEKGIGIIQNDKYGYVLVARESILTSEEDGPTAGTLIMGKILDDNFFANMREDLAIDIRIAEKGSTPSAEVIEMDDKILSTQLSVGNDLLIEVRKDRKYYQEKLSSMNDLFLVLALATALLVFLIYYLLDLLILSRVSLLSNQLQDVDFDKQQSLVVENSKNSQDEITDLEQSIQEMLESLEKAHADVSKLAYFDQLTGLPNRFSLYKEFKKRIDQREASFALMFFDLDGFKRINDLYGHSSGDQLLKQIGKRLTGNLLQTGSMLFRIGGDEFIYLTASTEKLELVREIENMMAALRKVFVLDGVTTTISTSIGVSFYPLNGETLDNLLHNADIAMYAAKKNGKNSYVFYDELSEQQLYKYLFNIQADLAYAAVKGQLFLEYQPIMDNEGNKIKTVEALVRWNHPTEGVIPPLKFIPIAEEKGLMREIGEWVIFHAVQDIQRWNKEQGQELSLAVNVSKAQLKYKDELLLFIDEVLAENQFPAELLQIEITESDTAAEHEEIASFIQELKLRNIQVALDDFGVGTSSLFHLLKLDVDIVKIDRSFLQHVPASQRDTEFLKGIYRTLNDLNIRLVTEGIETVEQKDFVTTKNNSYLQGYYFSKPLPLSKLVEIQERLEIKKF